ncbi:MAG: hypothetical protein NHB14_07315 [Desulfosporosinus sp.]|nr:hypothetical protein [Desulfosporosinus sp.]
MKSSINARIVKSHNVEVSTPRMVESLVGFQQLSACLAVLRVEEDRRNYESSVLIDERKLLRRRTLKRKQKSFSKRLEGRLPGL